MQKTTRLVGAGIALAAVLGGATSVAVGGGPTEAKIAQVTDPVSLFSVFGDRQAEAGANPFASEIGRRMAR
jgi:hypothetical protein